MPEWYDVAFRPSFDAKVLDPSFAMDCLTVDSSHSSVSDGFAASMSKGELHPFPICMLMVHQLLKESPSCMSMNCCIMTRT